MHGHLNIKYPGSVIIAILFLVCLVFCFCVFVSFFVFYLCPCVVFVTGTCAVKSEH